MYNPEKPNIDFIKVKVVSTVRVIFSQPPSFNQRMTSAIKVPHALGASCAGATPAKDRKDWTKREGGSLTLFQNIYG